MNTMDGNGRGDAPLVVIAIGGKALPSRSTTYSVGSPARGAVASISSETEISLPKKSGESASPNARNPL